MQRRQGSKSQMNDYEKKRMLRIEENKKELQARGLKLMANSLTSLVDSDKPKKNKKKLMDSNDKDVDVEYSPGSEEDHQEAAKKVSKKKRFVAPVVSRVLRSLESHGERDMRLHENEAGCCLTHLIDGDGTFNAVEFDNFIKQVKLGDGRPYVVVAIMGPLISGKNTLLNHLFHTNFKEMDASTGRFQTTKGIWISRCGDDSFPLTIVMDLEGTDSKERGEDDTAFEKQSACFAFAVSDIVLLNMWCHDIGLKKAANRPLLETVFQNMLQLSEPCKTTLMFVIRDQEQTETPLEKLESVLMEDIQKIWDSVLKPEVHKLTPLSEFFDVQFDFLPSYKERKEEFKNKVANLRQRFFHGVPALEFSSNAHNIWNAIKENKTLDAHKRVKPISQPIKVLSNLKKIADLGIKHVDLMKDSIFHSLSSVTKGRESSAVLIMALCKRYDQNKKGFQLNKKAYFSFCTKEVADIIGMEDKGISFEEYKTQNKFSASFPSFVKGSNTKKSTITAKEMKGVLSAMKVENDEAKENFRRLMTLYLIEEVLICNRNNKVQGSLWWMVSNLDACESVNWAKATEDHLHRSMKEAQTWLEKGDFHSGQHMFIGATPVLEAILYERIPDMRPSEWADVGSPIQKWKPHRRDDKWIEDKFSKLTSTSILPCKHCSASSGSPIFPSREAVNIIEEDVEETIPMNTGSDPEKDAVTGSQNDKSSQEYVFKVEDYYSNPEVRVAKILYEISNRLAAGDDLQGLEFKTFVKEIESQMTVPTCSFGKRKQIPAEDSETAPLKSQQKQNVKLDPQGVSKKQIVAEDDVSYKRREKR